MNRLIKKRNSYKTDKRSSFTCKQLLINVFLLIFQEPTLENILFL